MTMRVLFVNARPDSTVNPGGDTIQVVETRRGLEALGVHVEVREPSDLVELPDFDVAHVFNLQMPESALQVFERLEPAARPIAFSPIYWDTFACWFDTAVDGRALWKGAARVVGKEQARALYVRWQRLKAPRTATWAMQRRLLEGAACVLPNSQAEIDLLDEVFGFRGGVEGRATVVPNGVDAARYLHDPRPSEKFLTAFGLRDFVLQVGTLSPVKNQLGLIEALFDVPVPLVFIGHTPQTMRDYARQCCSRAEARGNVFFLDHLPAEDLPGVYALAAVHALPSWRETPGLVSLEAAASGCRVVTTTLGSAREYFGDFAWYCHPASVASIRAAVDTALHAPRTPALRGHVLEHYTWTRAAEATLAAYHRVVQPCDTAVALGA
jgi:glycosyltransferase involved in cell wall biosynthesis